MKVTSKDAHIKHKKTLLSTRCYVISVRFSFAEPFFQQD